jgi:hypothetical protein
VDDKKTPVWVRLVGAAVLLAMVGGSLLIVRRDSRAVHEPTAPSGAEEQPEPERPPEPDATTDLFSAGELGELQMCIATNATLEERARDGRLRGLLELSGGGQEQTAAYQDLVDVASGVEQLRGFRFSDPFKTKFVSSRKVADLAGKPGPPGGARASRVDDLALTALGVLRPGEHVRELYAELVTDQVAGFYRPRVDELVVPSPGAGESLTPFDKSILAHELEHALIDQRVGFSRVLPPRPSDRDGSLASLAVVEGSATLTGYRWTQAGLGFLDLLELTGDPRVSGAEQIPDAIPSYLMRQFTFPYIEGLQFVCDLYEKGGWKLVNRAIKNPPKTTLEILSPKLYFRGYKPPKLGQPPSPGPDWKHELETSFGAANWAWLLEAPGGNRGFGLESAEQLAREWATGKLHVWTKRGHSAVTVLGKSRRGGDLCVSLPHWYDVSFRDDVRVTPRRGLRAVWRGAKQSAALSCTGNEIRLAIGPNLSIALHLAQ